jgi:hypothetical protein
MNAMREKTGLRSRVVIALVLHIVTAQVTAAIGHAKPKLLPSWLFEVPLAEDVPNCLSVEVWEGERASNFIDANSRAFLEAKGLRRRDYVSNLRRAIDTWAIGFGDSLTTAVLTSDIQEVTTAPDAQTNIGLSAEDKTPEWAQEDGVITRPYVGSRQRCSIAELDASTREGVGQCPTSIEDKSKKCMEKCSLCNRCGPVADYLDEIYANKLQPNERTQSHQDWGWAIKEHDVPKFFMADLQEDRSPIVVATGHSKFFKKFVKKYSPKTDASCKLAAENKLHNGAVLAMTVKFPSGGLDPEVHDCRLVFGNLGGAGHERGIACQNFNAEAEKQPRQPSEERDVLLFAVRHGTSTWNMAKEKGLITQFKELQRFDAPLTPEGYMDAVALHRALRGDLDERDTGKAERGSEGMQEDDEIASIYSPTAKTRAMGGLRSNPRSHVTPTV